MTGEWGAILVVDDDAGMRELAHDVFQDRGHQVATAGSGQEALKLLAEQDYAVVLTDLRMKGMQGTELLAEVRHLYPDIGVILMTGFGSVDTAVEAMKRGASDYLTKPVKNDELVRVVERVIREASLRREVNRLRREVHKEYSFHQIIGKSKPMQEIFDLIRRVADSPTNLLITGESGTGKELVAKAIHYNSDRRDAPFIPVNCAAIPEQLLESELFGHMRGSFTDAHHQGHAGLAELLELLLKGRDATEGQCEVVEMRDVLEGIANVLHDVLRQAFLPKRIVETLGENLRRVVGQIEG